MKTAECETSCLCARCKREIDAALKPIIQVWCCESCGAERFRVSEIPPVTLPCVDCGHRGLQLEYV